MNKLKNSLNKGIDTEQLKKQVEQITDKSKLENKSDKIIRLSIGIEESRHKQLKMYCIEKDTNIQNIVSDLISALLDGNINL